MSGRFGAVPRRAAGMHPGRGGTRQRRKLGVEKKENKKKQKQKTKEA